MVKNKSFNDIYDIVACTNDKRKYKRIKLIRVQNNVT